MPVRAYKRIKIGKNSGVVISSGSGKGGGGCLMVLYWITIGWWLVPTIWIVKTILNGFSRLSSRAKIITLSVIAVLMMCTCLCGLIYSATPEGKAAFTARALTGSAEPTETEKSLYQTWTAAANRPTSTPRPTRTIKVLSSTPRYPTITPRPSNTLDPNRPCDCLPNYDCANFQTHQEAQTCFDYCGGSAAYNFAELDGSDRDGIVCESLP